MAFEDLQGGRLHNLSGEPVSVLCHLHSREVLPGGQRESPVYQFVPIALVLAIGTTEKSLALFSSNSKENTILHL